MEVTDLSEIVESTSAMSRDLEALRNEHQSLLAEYKIECVDSADGKFNIGQPIFIEVTR